MLSMLKNNISNNESQTIELKKKYGDKTLQTLSAFANTEGGAVIIGVNDDKSIIGIDYTNKDIEKFTEQIVNKLGVHPRIRIKDVSGKPVLIIEVQKSNIPISLDGKYYKRVGNTTREMKAEELKDFFIKDSNWDSLTNDYSISEIDNNTVKRFITMAIKAGRLKTFDEKENTIHILERLKLIINGKLTNAAILLFGKEPQKYFINANVRVLRLKDDIISIGDRLIEGNLFNQAEEAEEAIKNFINVRYEITGKLQRDSIWDYPLDSVREMLLNALIHRDYFKHNVQTQIKIFDDYFWCNNVGGLPQGITLEQLKSVHRSVPRNPLIMDIFYRAGLVEEYGSGTERMIRGCIESNLPEPEFKEEFGGFSVYFRKDNYTPEKLKKLGLNERQVKAVLYLKEKGKIANKDYQVLNNTTRETSKRDLEDLRNKGILNRFGVGRNINYKLNGSIGS